MKFALFLLTAGLAMAQPVATNLADAKWTHDKGDPPGAENVFLRQDPQTGGMELLVRYPGGPRFRAALAQRQRAHRRAGGQALGEGRGGRGDLARSGRLRVSAREGSAASDLHFEIALHVLHLVGR